MYILDKRGSGYKFYSSSGLDRYHDHHRYHPYKRSDRGVFPDEFKKAKPPTFDAELKNPEDEKAWLLGMNKLFELHEYKENMKARVAIFNLKGKAHIQWENVKQVRDMRTKELRCHALKVLFRKKYLSE